MPAKKKKSSDKCLQFMCHHSLSRMLYSVLVCVMVAAGLVIAISFSTPPAQALGLGFFGVGGRLAPAAPIFSDLDVLNFPPLNTCVPIVVIVGPEGTEWGAYQWGVAQPYDEWFKSYATNGFPYTHAGVYMLGTAVWPNPNPLCPLPMLRSIGTSLFKAGI